MDELKRRAIPVDLLERVLDNPGQIVQEQGGRKAYQSILEFPEGKIYMLRVIVDESVDPPVVVTAYRTSKISKYRRPV